MGASRICLSRVEEISHHSKTAAPGIRVTLFGGPLYVLRITQMSGTSPFFFPVKRRRFRRLYIARSALPAWEVERDREALHTV